MLDPDQFRKEVVRPTLEDIGLWSEAAEQLVVATALVESDLAYLCQIGGGPALGLYQIEPATHASVRRYLARKSKAPLRRRADRLLACWPSRDAQLISNLRYATAICRLIYWRRPEPLPAAGDARGLADYWKDHFNTRAGAGKPETFIALARAHIEEME